MDNIHLYQSNNLTWYLYFYSSIALDTFNYTIWISEVQVKVN